jgi:long-chain acyl-CoA synthetase
MTTGFATELHAALHSQGDRPMMEYRGEVFTRGQIAGYAAHILALLEAGDVPADASIGIVMRNRPLQGAAMLALIAAGRPLTSIYAFQAPALLARDVIETRFAAVIADIEDWSAELHEAADAVGAVGIMLSLAAPDRIVPVSGPDGHVQSVRRVTPLGASYHRIAGEPAIEILSSGTTGKPKRVRFPYPMLVRVVEMVKAGQIDDSLPVDICTWPFAGIGGMGNLVANLMIGRYMTVIDRFNVPEWVDAVRRHRPPFVSGPPAVAQMIVDAGVAREDVSSIRYFYGGSAPMPVALKDRLHAEYGITVIWAYGATEFCGTIISWTLPLHEAFGEAKKDAMGRPLPGITVRAVDVDSGAPMPVGGVGFLEAKVPAIGEAWIRTTDLASIDADGFVFHHGRGDGAIMRGGFKIVPETIVDALLRHPSIFDASVVGLPDARLGEVPVAAVQLRHGMTPISGPDIAAFLRQELAATYQLKAIRIVSELPRTASLKIDQRAVAALFDQ